MEREEMLDFKMQANAPRNVSEGEKEEEEQTSSTELTREDGRANRMKGINAQKELADMLRSWGLHVTVNYSRGMPDIIAKSSDKAAVFAIKAYTLSENGTKQRSVSKDDLLPEVNYSMKKKLPLVVAVKNLLTGKWWMRWVPVEELEDFNGIPTPVILAEDSAEAIRTLEESVNSVSEKLVGVR